ncbi:hypothetical protein [Bradyrhizobium sp. NBAIM03]|uniref:hypothetical protein n=1 Tax=Bradyrhizobium sp. NBAIM03 TaxID=2793816 RepID=UPI001CD19865|nr:hypothetical protein [Bradyrhizobium sp. NBAIM03]
MAINMLSMGSEQPPELPYLGHNGRELGLMLRGTKPLAYFLNFVLREFDVDIGGCSTDMSLRSD